tara:strand:- start:1687 stop:2295 length:609 start_codon:yes stop_codon:yes gene_type:complete
MFSGIVQEKGSIANLQKQNEVLSIEISCSENFVKDISVGDSVSVDGVCLTVTSKSSNSINFDAVNETLNRTIINNYIVGTKINLESSLKFGGSIGGHLMSGHIHQTAIIKEVLIIGDTKDLVIEVDAEWSKYLFEKGYVGLNGCSITIGQINDRRFKVHIIPETLRSTNLDDLVFGDQVNLELDQNTITITDTTERLLRDKA